MERAPLHLAWARSATPETCGAAIEVPLMYRYVLLVEQLAIDDPGAAMCTVCSP